MTLPPSGFDQPFTNYELDGAYDEMFESSGAPRASYQALHERLCEMSPQELRRRQQAADASFLHQGITFTVYGRDEGTEKIFPYDVLPRIITSAEWATIERGLTQRITALNLFLKDLYHEGKILNDRIIPREMVYTCRHYRREMRGLATRLRTSRSIALLISGVVHRKRYHVLTWLNHNL